MEFRILGPLQVLDGETPVELAGSKRRAVLALLLLHANEVVRTERLVDELWGEQPPRNASAALHNHVSRLRKSLGPDVLGRREWGYVLRSEEGSIDLSRFERLVAAAEPLPARQRSAKLAEALQLWRGPALADLTNEPCLQTEIARLDELRLTTQERRIDADLEAGRNAELVAEIEALIAANPLREHLRSQLILALYRAGRQAEALEVYRETRRVLTEELGLEPSPELRELEKAILRQDPAIAAIVPLPPPAAEPGRGSRRRGPLLAALLALLLLGLGLGAAFALAGHRRAHRAAHGVPVAATTSTPVVATTATTAHTTTQSLRATSARTTQRRPGSRRPRSSKQSSTRVVVLGTAPAHPATRRHAPNATTATTTTRGPTQKPRIVTISDNFDGNQIDGTIWSPWSVEGSGSGWTLSQHDGHLEFVFPPGTTPGGQYDNFGANLTTVCTFPFDFDARIHFTLVQWPPGNGVNAHLWTFFKPSGVGWDVGRSSWPHGADQYGSYLGPGRGGSVPLNDSSGTLRLKRRSGVITSYFLHKGRWLTLGAARNTEMATLGIGAGGVNDASGNGVPFPGQQVVVDFNNFTVTAANPICPKGAQRSG